jgi:hypothetical protein
MASAVVIARIIYGLKNIGFGGGFNRQKVKLF